MMARMLAATFVAILGAGPILVPGETMARGVVVGRSVVVGHHVVFPRVGARHVRRAPRPAVIPVPHVTPPAPSTGVTIRFNSFRAAALRRHHRIFGFGLPLTIAGGTPFYYYNPAELAGADRPPVAVGPADETAPIVVRSYPVALYRRGCQSQTQMVPSAAGSGEHRITIIRC